MKLGWPDTIGPTITESGTEDKGRIEGYVTFMQVRTHNPNTSGHSTRTTNLARILNNNYPTQCSSKGRSTPATRFSVTFFGAGHTFLPSVWKSATFFVMMPERGKNSESAPGSKISCNATDPTTGPIVSILQLLFSRKDDYTLYFMVFGEAPPRLRDSGLVCIIPAYQGLNCWPAKVELVTLRGF